MSSSPEAPARRSGGDLADYVSLLRRRRLIVLSMLLAGTGGGLALLWLTPPSYTASAQVLVTPAGPQEQVNQVTARQREPLNLDTEALLARSAVVAAKARGLFGGLSGPAEVSVPPNSSVLEISCTAAAPATAASCADAYALAYLTQRRETATQALSAQLRTVLAKLKQVNASLTSVATALPGLSNGTAERALALQRQNVLLRQVHALTARYDALRTVAVTPGSVISRPVAPTEPRAPRPPLYLGSGLMAGLLCGVGAAWVRDRLDTTVRDAADVRRLTGLDAIDDEGLRGLAGAVLVVSVPGTSPREVRRAARALRERGVPVAGTLLTGGASSSPAAQPPHTPRPGGKRARADERATDGRGADGRSAGGQGADGRGVEGRDTSGRGAGERGAGGRGGGGLGAVGRGAGGLGPGGRDAGGPDVAVGEVSGRVRGALPGRTARPLAGLAGGHRAAPPPSSPAPAPPASARPAPQTFPAPARPAFPASSTSASSASHTPVPPASSAPASRALPVSPASPQPAPVAAPSASASASVGPEASGPDRSRTDGNVPTGRRSAGGRRGRLP